MHAIKEVEDIEIIFVIIKRISNSEDQVI